MKHIIFTIFTCLTSMTLWAETTWTCKNSINEVRCNKSTCKSSLPVASSFDVKINNNQNVSVCTQGKCWSGQTKKNTQNQELYEVRQFGWTVQHEPNSEYLLGVNNSNKSLYLQSGSKKTSLQCNLV